MTRTIRFSLLFLVLMPTTVFAQVETPALRPNSAVGPVDIINAVDGTATYDNAQGIARLTKDVVVTQRNEYIVIEGQQVTYNHKLNQATIAGAASARTLDSSIKGQNLVADFKVCSFTLSGQVTITAHGKNDGIVPRGTKGNGRKSVRIVCDQVEWDYNKRQATATGNVQFFLGNSQGTCDKVVYNETQNTLLLSGDPEFNAQARAFKGEDIRINVDSNEIIGSKKMNVRFLKQTPNA